MAYTKTELADWITDKAKTAAGYRKGLITDVERQRASNETAIGRMYFFWYDPKWKKVLPIYDRFPLVLPIEQYKDGFLGLNLHYLNQGARVQLLGKLAQYKNNSKFDATTRLKLSYNLLKGTSTMKLAEQCIHRYLFPHVRSRFIEVAASEWDKAIQLPVEVFVTKK